MARIIGHITRNDIAGTFHIAVPNYTLLSCDICYALVNDIGHAFLHLAYHEERGEWSNGRNPAKAD